jgi:hypothetical protein
MKDASNDLQIKWYTAWQEVVEKQSLHWKSKSQHVVGIVYEFISLCTVYTREDDLD